jgi:hypothetical protein
MASTSVVLPWSTWAMIAMFRMSSRTATSAPLRRVECVEVMRFLFD